jgi:hypothetical protein
MSLPQAEHTATGAEMANQTGGGGTDSRLRVEATPASHTWIRIDFITGGVTRVPASSVPPTYHRGDVHLKTIDVAHMPTCRYERWPSDAYYMGRPIADRPFVVPYV